MYYAILSRKDGKVHELECDQRDIDERCEDLDGVLITQAETPERYRKKRLQDQGGKFPWG